MALLFVDTLNLQTVQKVSVNIHEKIKGVKRNLKKNYVSCKYSKYYYKKHDCRVVYTKIIDACTYILKVLHEQKHT